jgi:hypothetical protein
VTTSTIRFAIIVALIVGGVAVINSAFPDTSSSAGSIPDGGPVPTVTTTPSPSASKTPKPSASPTVVGVKVAVFNGTSVSGLAGDVADDLQKEYGMVPVQVDNAPSPVAETTIYYRTPKDQVEAEFIATDYFKDLDPQVVRLESGTDVDRDVQVAIYLGNDYAQQVG